MHFITGDAPERRKARWSQQTILDLQTQPGVWADVRCYYNELTAKDAVRRLRQKGCEARWSYEHDQYHVYARWPLRK